MAGKLARESIDFWQGQIRLARKYRKSHSEEEHWELYSKWAKGNMLVDKDVAEATKKLDAGMVIENMPAAYEMALMRNVLPTLPVPHITPTFGGFQLIADILMRLDGIIFTALDAGSIFRKMIKSTFREGAGYIHITYGDGVIFDEDNFDFSDNKDRPINCDSRFIVGLPYMKALYAHEMLIDPLAEEFETARWAAHIVNIDKADFDRHPILQKFKDVPISFTMNAGNIEQHIAFIPANDSLGGTTIKQISKQEQKEKDSGDSIEIVQLIVIFDKITRKNFVISEGYDKFLFDKETKLINELGLPYQHLSFRDRDDSPNGVPDIHLIRHAASELNNVLTTIGWQRKLTMRKFLFRDGAIDEKYLDLFLSNEQLTHIPVENIGERSIKDVIYPLNFRIPQELFESARELRRIIQRVLGFSANTSAEFSQGRHTATEVNAVSSSYFENMDVRRRDIAKAIVGVTRKLNYLIGTIGAKLGFGLSPFSEEENQIIYQFAGEDLLGTFTYSIAPVELSPDTPESEQRRLMGGLQLAQSTGMPVQPIIERLLSSVLRNPEMVSKIQKGMEGGQGAILRLPMSKVQEGVGESGSNQG